MKNNSAEKDIFAEFGFYTVPDLTDADRTPPDFLISGMLPCGMTFLSGAPKTRKSFLAIQIAIAVATGKPFFGRQTTQCDVAYFDLEGSKSRISYRTAQMTTRIPRNVFIANEVKEKLAGKLVDRLRLLHRQHPVTGLYPPVRDKLIHAHSPSPVLSAIPDTPSHSLDL